MNGVEILSSQTIYNTILPDWVIPIALSMFIASLVLCILFAIDFEKAGTIICLILTIAGIVLFALSMTSDTTDINRIEYKVTIDDSVSMNEFLDKYEILNQEGKIYTVKEKNNE
jgi:hypothetical protein